MEYSVDHGSSWTPVVSQCSSVDPSLPSCTDMVLRPTTFYAGVFSHWQRVIVPLSGLHVCGYCFTCCCVACYHIATFTHIALLVGYIHTHQGLRCQVDAFISLLPRWLWKHPRNRWFDQLCKDSGFSHQRIETFSLSWSWWWSNAVVIEELLMMTILSSWWDLFGLRT